MAKSNGFGPHMATCCAHRMNSRNAATP